MAAAVVQVKATAGATPYQRAPPPLSLLEAFQRLEQQTDVHLMSTAAFGQDYDDVQKVIYPLPAYRGFLIKKRSGGMRLIEEPREPVKRLQLKALVACAHNAAG